MQGVSLWIRPCWRWLTDSSCLCRSPAHDPGNFAELCAILRLIKDKRCVDQGRISLTGHSEGGTISMGMAYINGTGDILAAIASSAVGITLSDLADRSCPVPLPVMLMHVAHDTLFPGYGKGVVAWLAQHGHPVSSQRLSQAVMEIVQGNGGEMKGKYPPPEP